MLKTHPLFLEAEKGRLRVNNSVSWIVIKCRTSDQRLTYLSKSLVRLPFLPLTTPFQRNGARTTGLLTTVKERVATRFQRGINDRGPFDSLCRLYPRTPTDRCACLETVNSEAAGYAAC